MREWILEKMRRRSRRGPNESESTGKSGQELPAGQLAPLRPTYPEPLAVKEAEPEVKDAGAEKPVISESSELPVDMAPLGDEKSEPAEARLAAGLAARLAASLRRASLRRMRARGW